MALALPVMAGFVDSPLARQVQHTVLAAQARAQQAVAVVAQQIGVAPVTPVTVAELAPLKAKVAAATPRPSKIEALSDEPAPVQAAPIQAAPVEPPPEPPVAIAAPAPAPIPVSKPVLKDAVMALYPRGDGDPDAVTCRVPQQLPGSRLSGPSVCETNRVWAHLRANKQEIGPDGVFWSPSRISMDGICGKSALLAAFQSRNALQGLVLTGCS
jgi:hypothetical protein